MRKTLAALLLAALLALCACDTGPGMDLRLFCERFNRASDGRARLDPGQFTAEENAGGMKFTAYAAMGEYVACQAAADGRIHTVSLTGLPDAHQKDFYAAALCLLEAYAALTGDGAERLLQELALGAPLVLGMNTLERGGLRLSYAANAAGRYFRLSRLRGLPPEPELATLREQLTMDNGQ